MKLLERLWKLSGVSHLGVESIISSEVPTFLSCGGLWLSPTPLSPSRELAQPMKAGLAPVFHPRDPSTQARACRWPGTFACD